MAFKGQRKGLLQNQDKVLDTKSKAIIENVFTCTVLPEAGM